jgi:hypothetical protein
VLGPVEQITCLADGIKTSACANNLTAACICSNVPLQTQVSLCVSANCTMKEALGKH